MTCHRSYYAIIRTGNINFRVALDTGSSDLWLLSTDCDSSACSGLPRYPLAYESSTFVPVNDNNTIFSTHFADGTGALLMAVCFPACLMSPQALLDSLPENQLPLPT